MYTESCLCKRCISIPVLEEKSFSYFLSSHQRSPGQYYPKSSFVHLWYATSFFNNLCGVWNIFLKLEMKLNDSKIIEELLTLLLQLVTIITQVEIKLHISCPRLSAYVLWTYQFTNIKHDVVLLKKIIILRKK